MLRGRTRLSVADLATWDSEVPSYSILKRLIKLVGEGVLPTCHLGAAVVAGWDLALDLDPRRPMREVKRRAPRVVRS